MLFSHSKGLGLESVGFVFWGSFCQLIYYYFGSLRGTSHLLTSHQAPDAN